MPIITTEDGKEWAVIHDEEKDVPFVSHTFSRPVSLTGSEEGHGEDMHGLLCMAVRLSLARTPRRPLSHSSPPPPAAVSFSSWTRWRLTSPMTIRGSSVSLGG
jgi:hypothetical protein